MPKLGLSHKIKEDAVTTADMLADLILALKQKNVIADTDLSDKTVSELKKKQNENEAQNKVQNES